MLIYGIALLGLNLLTGFNGQLSLGHGAFFGLGGYGAAILIVKFGLPYWAAIPIAGAGCFVASFLFGFPALRFGGLYLALAWLLGIREFERFERMLLRRLRWRRRGAPVAV